MRGDECSWVSQFVVSPHPEREEDDGGQAYDGNQGVKQSAEELGLRGKWVGSGCRERNSEDSGKKRKKMNKIGLVTGVFYLHRNTAKAMRYQKLLTVSDGKQKHKKKKKTACLIGLTLCYIISKCTLTLLTAYCLCA